MTEATSAPVALVTGGGRGIGRHAAIALAQAGHRVAVLARSGEQLAETVRLIGAAAGGDADAALAVRVDVTNSPSVAAAVAEVEARWGRIDVLVNNAGMASPPSTLIEADIDAWWRLIEVNLRGPMLLCRYVVPGMVARGHGRVININSLAGVDARTAGFASDYAVSKAGLFRLTHVLAAELEGTGVSVLDLSPGLVFTQMTDNEGFAVVPADQWTDIDDAATAVVRLASGEFDALSGRFIHTNENFDELLANVELILAQDARVLTLRTWGDEDGVLG